MEMIVKIRYHSCAPCLRSQVINVRLKTFMVIQFKLRNPLSDGFMMKAMENVNPSCIPVVAVMIIGLKRKHLVMMFASPNPVTKNLRKARKEKSIARIMQEGNKSIGIWNVPTYWVNIIAT